MPGDDAALFEVEAKSVTPQPSPLRPSRVPSGDPEVDRVAAWFGAQRDGEKRFADALRRSLDEVLDGQRTGRFDVKYLEKTEKTYLGTKIEIVVRTAFEIDRGRVLDYRIADVEVDAKYSTKFGGWMLPRESLGHICLLLHADDARSVFWAGLLRVDPALLRGGANQDAKRSLLAAHYDSISWLHERAPLTENLLLHLSASDRQRIFRFTGRRDGQQRVNELFRLVHSRIVTRETVLTVGKQDDPMKRARDARLALAQEGVLILGHQNDHPRIARALHLPVPAKGEFVALRPTDTKFALDGRRIDVAGRVFGVAAPDSPQVSVRGGY